VELEPPLVPQSLLLLLVTLDSNYIKVLVLNVPQEPMLVLPHKLLNVQLDTL